MGALLWANAADRPGGGDSALTAEGGLALGRSALGWPTAAALHRANVRGIPEA
jgi:hypothetical protein